jgi:hypothetical protein
MTEHTLVKQLLTLAREELKGYVIQKHNDRANFGTPDISITGLGFTSWWEIKCANPTFDSPGIQELTCIRLAVAGYCRYLIYDFERLKNPTTYIIHPKDIRHGKRTPCEWVNDGIAHRQFIVHVAMLHKRMGNVL